MNDDIFAYVKLLLKKDGYTEFDMEGTNEDLLYGISAILSKMVIDTNAPKKDTIKLFLNQIKDDVNSIIDSNAWGTEEVKSNVIQFISR